MRAFDSRTSGSFVLALLRPYRSGVAIILAAMIFETIANLAAPWPLKVVIDNAIGGKPLPDWLAYALPLSVRGDGVLLAAACGGAVVAIAAAGAIASYVDNYYTESVGQWVANDLRLRVYDHLEHLSLSYYDSHQTGTLLSTLTDDVATIQDFASSSTLGILIDVLTIVGMIGLMFWLNWDFALIAVAVTPFLLLFVTRFKKAVKTATQEVRRRQADIVAVLQQGLESMRVVKAFGRQQLEQEQLRDASLAQCRCGAQSAARQVPALARDLADGRAMHGIRALARRALILAGTHDGRFAHRVPGLPEPVLQAGPGPGEDDQSIAQAAVGLERIRAVLDADMRIPEREGAVVPASITGSVEFEHVAFGYTAETTVLRDVSFSIPAGSTVGDRRPNRRRQVHDPQPDPALLRSARRLRADRWRRCSRLRARPAARSRSGSCCRIRCSSPAPIRDNIAYGRPDATDDEIVAAAKLANADDFIAPHAPRLRHRGRRTRR